MVCAVEEHRGHIPDGVWAKVCQRVLALALALALADI
jgi:hypothetical protein